MKLHAYVGGIAGANSYVLELEDHKLIIIDAAHNVTPWLKKKFPEATVTHLLITHAHFDHVMDAHALQQAYQCKIIAGAPFNKDATLIEGARKNWGLDVDIEPYQVTEVLTGEITKADWGNLSWEALHVPGHSDDSIVYHLIPEKVMFTGDTIFDNSIGRTDLPGGHFDLLISKLRKHILSKDGDTALLPGHGSDTTVSREERTNPFL